MTDEQRALFGFSEQSVTLFFHRHGTEQGGASGPWRSMKVALDILVESYRSGEMDGRDGLNPVSRVEFGGPDGPIGEWHIDAVRNLADGDPGPDPEVMGDPIPDA